LQPPARVSAITSISPSIPPAEDERSPELLAVRILARERGVVTTESWALSAARALGRAVGRALALPVSLVLGLWVGTFAAPFWSFASMPWFERVLFVVFSPLLGLYFGAEIGWRLLTTGKLRPTPLVAAAFHRYAPVFTLPKALTHHALGIVLVTTYGDVRDVLERDDVFRVDLYNERMQAATGAFFLGEDDGRPYRREESLGMACLGRDEALLRECVGRVAQALVDRALDRPTRTLDVVTEYAHVVVVTFLKDYFGVPDTADERLLDWLETMSFFLFNFWIGGPYRAEAVRAGDEIRNHLLGLVRARMADIEAGRPITEDALGRLVLRLHAASPDKPIDEKLAARTLAGLVSGATVATIGTAVQVIDRLLDLPADLRKKLQHACLTKNDVTVRRFVLEAARFGAYPPTLYRHAAKPFVFAPGTDREKEVEAGAWVVTLPILANYDASVFAHPETFDPARGETRKDQPDPLIFGWARHRCLGEHVAELLIVELVRRLFAKNVTRFPGPQGRLTQGPPGVIPSGDYARRLIVRFNV
jgi:cytochrome P450